MKKFLYLMLLFFVFVLGMRSYNNDSFNGNDISDRIEDFEDKVNEGEDLSEFNDYVIDEGPVNSLAKKSESVIKNLVDKLKSYLS